MPLPKHAANDWGAIAPEKRPDWTMAFRPRFPPEDHLHIADGPLGLRGKDAGDRVDLAHKSGLVRAELAVAIGEEILASTAAAGFPCLLEVFGV